MEEWLKEEFREERTRYSIDTAGGAEVGRGRREKQDEVKKTKEGSREEGRMAGKMSMRLNIAWDQG